MRTATLLPCALLVLLIVPAPAAAGTITFTNISDPASPGFTQVLGINNAGALVGKLAGDYTDNGENPIFVYNGSTFNNFYLAYDGPTFATGISASGQIVGFIDDTILGGDTGFLYSGGTTYTIGPPSASNTFAQGISENSAEIAGYFSNATGSHGFLYNGSSYLTLDDPNATGTGATYATGVNNSGEAAGFYQDSAGSYQGFVYNGTAYTTIVDPNACATCSTYVTGINDSGEIVGYYSDAARITHGFLDNNGVFTTLDDSLGTNTWAYGIDDSGVIAGSYQNATATGGFTATVTVSPEPATWLPMGGGFFLLAGYSRRRFFQRVFSRCRVTSGMKTYAMLLLLTSSCAVLRAQSFTVSPVESDRKWRLGFYSRTYNKVGEDLAKFLTEELTKSGASAGRISIEVVEVSTHTAAFGKQGMDVVATASVQDASGKQLYSKVYRGESRSLGAHTWTGMLDMAERKWAEDAAKDEALAGALKAR
jgi:hypothetical protein